MSIMQKMYRAFCSRHFIAISVLSAVYFITAQFGLSVSAVNTFSALVWPPSGLSIAALLIFGRQLWPGIFLGAFLANVFAGAPIFISLGIATGNTLEAIVALSICGLASGRFQKSLERPEDVIRLIIAAVISTLASATIGVSSLWLGGSLQNSQLLMSWLQWWAGDVLGILSLTPLLLVFYVKNPMRHFQWKLSTITEPFAFAILLFALSGLIFSGALSTIELVGEKNLYILVPILLWGAMRFDQLGATVATFVISNVAVWNTAHGIGPFSDSYFTANISHLMLFTITITLTGLFVGSVVCQLNAAKNAAEAANLAKSSFLANMSHEIRTPLGAVMGFAELVADKACHDEDRTTFIAAIQRNGEMLSKLINDLLDLSKIEAGKSEIQISKVSITEIIQDIETLFTKSAKEKGIELSLKIDQSVPDFIYTDPLRLRQILNNMIGNAIKFTHQGSVSLNVQLAPSPQRHPLLSFIVRDTGIGIRQEDMKKLFSPFSQADNSTKRLYGGTGLGLSLSRRLAILLGGNIELTNSTAGHGSQFFITIDPGKIPNPYTEKNASVSHSTPPIASLNGIKILLAEDSKDNQILVQQILNSSGAKVTIVNNGQEALEKTKAASFDIIIMDLQMPVMDGYEATKALRSNGYKGTIVALSAHALQSDRERCLSSGFDEHFSKPINKSVLIERLALLAT